MWYPLSAGAPFCEHLLDSVLDFSLLVLVIVAADALHNIAGVVMFAFVAAIVVDVATVGVVESVGKNVMVVASDVNVVGSGTVGVAGSSVLELFDVGVVFGVAIGVVR